ncbi:SusC/RagA family TonB-linked outer membrane protein [Dyadobacter endophyticus]|uniref:SusC/RagA family TonB-linked outer membrane protein n=1 Tax=Dyadobacter endophyticus TaxID=1749036 RepID=A0ABQ1YUN2_9BACT|nr:TonB-dependent receptor [Dyadobacter endophyticus]GGH38306.1 SusC/RagA family TonB-linked outer membrane protein [Dyadobacter endophyticus]
MKIIYKNPMRDWLTFLLLFLTIFSAIAQDRRVTGVVSDPAGTGIPGATILIKGTQIGSNTDADGRFAVNVRSDKDVLVISFVGYKTREIIVGNQSVIDVKMEDDVAALEEVVVTGYTTDKRRETSGSVALVKAKDLTAVPSGNVEQQLQGRVAGVTVITNGQPGTNSQIRVRGFGSFEANEPLYIVDGVPVGSTDFLNPDDIDQTTVLKDAAAASIYGARAAAGVVVYTTKKGTRNRKLSVTYDGLVGFTTPGNGQKMMNPTDFADWTWNAFRNSGWKPGDQNWTHPQFGTGAQPVIPDYLMVGGTYGVTGNVDLAAERKKYNVDPTAGSVYQVVRANRAGTDWYDAITRTAPVTRHSLGFSGGGENGRYFVGLGLQDQQGILLNNSFKRYSFRVNTEFNILKNLRFGENIQGTYRQVLGIGGANNGQGVANDENDILSAFRMPSIIPVYDEFGGYAGTAAKGFNNPRNPVATRDGMKNNNAFNANGFGNVYLEFDPIENLTLRSSLGGQYNNYTYWNYSRRQYENSENNSAVGYGEGSGYRFAWTFTNTAQYRKTFGLHNLDVLVGQEALNTGVSRDLQASGLNPFSNDINYVNMSNVSSKVTNSQLSNGVTFYSLFGRLNYIFNDRYIVSGVLRRDGSSRFGAANRYGVFPAVSVAWRVTSENFMKGVTFLSDLKIRGGYGTMGNSNAVRPDNQYSLYSAGIGTSAYDITGSNTSAAEGYYRSKLGNADAKWETSITKNIGFDATFFNGKLDVILDLWQKDSKDLLFQKGVPAVVGSGATPPYVNAGTITNKGIDFQIITKGKVGSKLGYELNVTGGILKNEIGDLGGDKYLAGINPGYRGLQPIRNQLGYSLSAFYGYKVTGLFQTQEEVDRAPAQDGKGIGRFRYEDINGDNLINADDRTYLGSPVPKFTGGLNLKLTYLNFELETYMYTSVGNKIFNASKWFTDFYPSFAGAAISERVKDSWSPSNTGATIPIFESASNFSTNTQANSFYVENGNYVRMQNISLGYNLPKTLLAKLKMQKLRLYASANNIFTISKYQGLDPGVGGNADTQFGIDVGNYPVTRSWVFGLNLGF